MLSRCLVFLKLSNTQKRVLGTCALTNKEGTAERILRSKCRLQQRLASAAADIAGVSRLRYDGVLMPKGVKNVQSMLLGAPKLTITMRPILTRGLCPPGLPRFVLRVLSLRPNSYAQKDLAIKAAEACAPQLRPT